jgi:hypothetical protein
MATLQAIAYGLGVIEVDRVKVQLMKLYHAKIERTLIGRGLSRKTCPEWDDQILT